MNNQASRNTHKQREPQPAARLAPVSFWDHHSPHSPTRQACKAARKLNTIRIRPPTYTAMRLTSGLRLAQALIKLLPADFLRDVPHVASSSRPVAGKLRQLPVAASVPANQPHRCCHSAPVRPLPVPCPNRGKRGAAGPAARGPRRLPRRRPPAGCAAPGKATKSGRG